MPDLRPVILSGGSGTRLWPLSSPDLPKQFAPLLGVETLFSRTVARLDGMEGRLPAIVVTGAAHVELVVAEAAAANLETSAVIVEPVGRNTAPAVIAAAMVAGPADVLLVLPSDHLLDDQGGFRSAVETAAGLAESGSIVTFGVRPTRPETGYGYIEIGETVDGAFSVSRFKEKPAQDEAEVMFADRRHLWNSGMFVTRADRVLEEARRLAPEVLDAVGAALPDPAHGIVTLSDEFGLVPSISFDHAIMERTDRAVVVPLDIGWNDVGSYRSLLAAADTDGSGNHVGGDVTLSDVRGSFIRATSRRVVVVGVEEMVVVETPDAVLVVPLERADEVRDLGSEGRQG